MFRAVPLPIIRSFPLYIRHWYMSCRFDDIPVPNVQWKTSDDGQRNCPKHVEFLDKINLWSASVGIIKKKFVTMYCHMNVKKKPLTCRELCPFQGRSLTQISVDVSCAACSKVWTWGLAHPFPKLCAVLEYQRQKINPALPLSERSEIYY